MSDWKCCIKGCKDKDPEYLWNFPGHGVGVHDHNDYCEAHYKERTRELRLEAGLGEREMKAVVEEIPDVKETLDTNIESSNIEKKNEEMDLGV